MSFHQTYSEYVEATETEPTYGAIEYFDLIATKKGYLDFKVSAAGDSFLFGPMEIHQPDPEKELLDVFITIAGTQAKVFKDIQKGIAEFLIESLAWNKKS